MIKKIINKIWRKYLCYTNPEKLASILYKSILNREPDFTNPKSFNEKINWLKFNSDTRQWTKLADKYLVSNFVRQKGLEKYLIQNYGVWDNVEDIDFENLPKRFVLKSNNGCKTVMLVKDKSLIDEEKVKKVLKNWMKIKFGYDTAEPHYLDIKPCIIAEEYLGEEKSLASSLIDYKFICINGEPTYVKVYSNRDEINKAKYDLSIYDIDWVPCFEYLNREIHSLPVEVSKPKTLKTMLNICRILSKDFPQVRIDLYEVSSKTFFGEMTFTSFGGYDPDFTTELDLKIGEMLKV